MTKRFDKFIQPADGIVVVSRAQEARRASGRRQRPGSAGLAPALTRGELSTIIRKIRPIFGDTASRFDTKKYPDEVYKQALIAFAHPGQVSPGDIRNALLWKYGHLRKGDRIPAAHRKLIAELQQEWPRLARNLPRAPEQAFAAIDGISGGRTRFITVAFLVHLLSPERVPIVDQNNFRAVNALISYVRPTWYGKKQPSRWLDVVLVGAFMNAVISAWRAQASASAPTPRKLDQFLMIYGKDLKARRAA